MNVILEPHTTNSLNRLKSTFFHLKKHQCSAKTTIFVRAGPVRIAFPIHDVHSNGGSGGSSGR